MRKAARPENAIGLTVGLTVSFLCNWPFYAIGLSRKRLSPIVPGFNNEKWYTFVSPGTIIGEFYVTLHFMISQNDKNSINFPTCWWATKLGALNRCAIASRFVFQPSFDHKLFFVSLKIGKLATTKYFAPTHHHPNLMPKHYIKYRRIS